MALLTWLELPNEFSPKCPAHAVEKLSEAAAVNIVLDIARIELIEQIKDAESDASFDLFVRKPDRDRSRQLQIEGGESRKSQRVPRSDKLALLIDHGIRKAGVNVQNRKHRQLEGQFPLAPGQKPVGSIEGESPAGVWSYDSGGVIAEKLIEIIEIAISFRPHIRSVQRAAADLVLPGNLKLAIERAAAV